VGITLTHNGKVATRKSGCSFEDQSLLVYSPYMEIVFSIVILILSVIVHEVAHGYAALWQGDRTAQYQGRLTLNPLVHLDPIGSVLIPLISYQFGFIFGWAKPVPYNPYNVRNGRVSEALIAAAGPLSNFFLAFVFGLVIRSSDILGLSPAFVSIASLAVFINVILALFNLIPIPPLDGSKILFAWLSWDSPVRQFLERYGFALVLVFVFFFFDFVRPIASALFLLFTGSPTF
jgi:Zn-dependent protease